MIFNFRSPGFYRVIQDAEVIELSSFTPSEATELINIIMGVYIVGNRVNESLTLRLHTSTNFAKIFAQSTINLTEIGVPLLTNWIGQVRFDFDNINLSLDQKYYLTLVASDYARNADTFYLSLPFDRPQSFDNLSLGTLAMNISPAPSSGYYHDYPIEHKLFGKK